MREGMGNKHTLFHCVVILVRDDLRHSLRRSKPETTSCGGKHKHKWYLSPTGKNASSPKKTILGDTTVVQIREKSKQHSAVLSDQHFKYFRLRVKKYLENFSKKWNSSIIILITSIALGESCQNSLPPNGKDRPPLQWLPCFKRSNLTRKKPATNKEVKIQRNTP